VAGVGGLELRNVDANYLFERSHRFAGIQPNSGLGDYSPLSCSAADTQLGPSARRARFFRTQRLATPVLTLKPGDDFQVPPETPHAGNKNGNEKTKVAVTYVVKKGKPLASPA